VIDKCDLKDAIVVLRPSTDDSLRTLDLKVIEQADSKWGFYEASDPANLTSASSTYRLEVCGKPPAERLLSLILQLTVWNRAWAAVPKKRPIGGHNEGPAIWARKVLYWHPASSTAEGSP
jgi:hypothetical protein